ncbi:unnamed protein product [Effrenium voratum]|nr:unnamed protein product [Effrenium voratum]
MACELGEGSSLAEAIREVEDMKAAALSYAKSSPGWSEQVGLFVNIFGHNNVNSLFVHIIDMEELGPSFEAQGYKNCPLDAVLKVLKEEVEEHFQPQLLQVLDTAAFERGVSLKDMAGGFRGAGGATSLKEELVERVPVLRDAGAFREARRIFREEYGGLKALKAELAFAGFVDSERLTTTTKPFNLFARIAAGEMQQPGMEQEQAALKDFGAAFCVCKNKPENDAQWDSEDPEWVGKASMSARHRFLTTRDLRWTFFNALTLGMTEEEGEEVPSLAEAIQLLEDLKAAALTYVANVRGWSPKLGLYFHVFGHNSVNSLHLHVVDMAQCGPTFQKLKYKNCSLNAVLKVLQEELALASEPRKSPMLPAVASRAQTEAERFGRVPEAVELNVGGELLTVSWALLLHLPVTSALRQAAEGKPREGEALAPAQDRQGRVFLDLPGHLARAVLDLWRLRCLRGGSEPRIPCANEDQRLIAEVLGVPVEPPARVLGPGGVALLAAGVGAACAVVLRRGV